ncbi:MAG: exodeoxyribonuclease VII large subunit [Lachnospiraceae bacterium]
MTSVYSVGQVNTYIKNMFVQDFVLHKISVRGEVSNCKYHTSGHIYFSLKDETSAMNCVMFAGSRQGLRFTMKNGDKVVVNGSVNVYERDGRYQLYASSITLEGAGELYERFLALKNELQEMGMFADEYKKPIPQFIKTLGIVTAPTGAVLQDISTVSLRRNPYLQLVLYPAIVQGDAAKASIVRGIQALDAYGVDVIIVGRGGGSIEDLWAFNEAEVAKAVFECATPIIAAVGHETDVTITDYVADLRAATPSAAAELAVDDIRKIEETLQSFQRRARLAMDAKLHFLHSQLEQYRKNLSFLSPSARLLERRQYLLDLQERLTEKMRTRMLENRHQLELYIEKLDGLSPLKKLGQGYSFVADGQGKSIKSIEEIKVGDIVHISLTDGKVQATIDEIVRKEWGQKHES